MSLGLAAGLQAFGIAGAFGQSADQQTQQQVPAKTKAAQAKARVSGSAKTPQKPAASAAPIHGETLVIQTHAEMPKIDGLDKDRCFEIREIAIHGIEMVKVDEVRKAVEPFAYHCMGNMLAKSILSAINELHANKGLVTTQGYVPQQDIKKDRKLVINIVTGRIGKIVVHEHAAYETFFDALKRTREAKTPWEFLSGVSGMAESLGDRLDRFTLLSPKTFPGLKEWLAMPADPNDPLNIDHIQQGIDQLNKSPSQHASAKLQPGDAPGTSDVVVDVPRANSFRLSMGYEVNGANLNNANGASSTNQRLRFDIAKDNLIGLNDNWTGSFASGVDSNEARVALTVPVRWLTLSLFGGYSETLQLVDSTDTLYTRELTTGLNGSYLVSRDAHQQTSIDGGVTWRNNARWVDDVKLSPQNVTVARLGLTHTRFLDNAQLVLSGGLNQGLQVSDATRDPSNADYTVPRAQFFKIDGSMSYSKAFAGYGVAKLDVTGQWTHDALFQDDQLIFGSVSTVRGFARNPGVADRGINVRSEFDPDMHIGTVFTEQLAKDYTFAYDALRNAQPYIFADYGYGRNIAATENVRRVSAGVGLRYALGRVNFDWTAAKPLMWGGQRTEPLQQVTPKIDRFETYFTLTVKLL